jgi:hypothetical protein
MGLPFDERRYWLGHQSAVGLYRTVAVDFHIRVSQFTREFASDIEPRNVGIQSEAWVSVPHGSMRMAARYSPEINSFLVMRLNKTRR